MQRFVSHSSCPADRTIGPMTAARLGITRGRCGHRPTRHALGARGVRRGRSHAVHTRAAALLHTRVTRAVRLRPWQQRALTRLDATPGPDFLAVATPGAGKTTFALTALRRRLAQDPHRQVVVVAPTAHLKAQWAEAAARFDLALDDAWSPQNGRLPEDLHGVVTTYQQVASSADALRPLARGALVVFDEIHHAGDERAWGDGIRTAFDGSAWRLALSGTPFRSDTRAIPFVTYALDEAMPSFEYGYGDALADGRVVRQVEFPRLNGDMEWVAPDGSLRAASFDDALEPALAAQRLRTALSAEGEWLPAVLDAAHARLTEVRRGCPDAAGLVIAGDQEHARDIADLLQRRHGVRAVVATSDDPEASRRIARFRDAPDPWIVAVRMVSEGVDIPRLRVGVFATTTTTELFFRQAVGRLVRWRAQDEESRRVDVHPGRLPPAGKGAADRRPAAAQLARRQRALGGRPGSRPARGTSRRAALDVRGALGGARGFAVVDRHVRRPRFGGTRRPGRRLRVRRPPRPRAAAPPPAHRAGRRHGPICRARRSRRPGNVVAACGSSTRLAPRTSCASRTSPTPRSTRSSIASSGSSASRRPRRSSCSAVWPRPSGGFEADSGPRATSPHSNVGSKVAILATNLPELVGAAQCREQSRHAGDQPPGVGRRRAMSGAKSPFWRPTSRSS